MELLDRNPGMNKHQVATSLGVHDNAVDFHLQRLTNAGLVETRPATTGRETLCFTADNVRLWENTTTRILFGRAQPRLIALFFAENPGAGVQEAADALGLSLYTVRKHIRTLEECDLVQRMRVDRDVIYHAEPELMAWVKEVERGRRLGES